VREDALRRITAEKYSLSAVSRASYPRFVGAFSYRDYSATQSLTGRRPGTQLGSAATSNQGDPDMQRSIPNRIYDQIRNGFVESTAGDMVRWFTDATQDDNSRRAAGGRPVAHPGSPFGGVVAWLWLTAPDEVPELLADLLGNLRYHGPHARKIDPPITLDELLVGLRMAVPPNFTDRDLAALEDKARVEVPKYFGTNPNSPEA
jgi:hypothetical protein